jgi:hypothetical protein
MNREFDSPWKEVLDLLLPEFLLRFDPQIHAAIDWSKPYENRDAEFRQIWVKRNSANRASSRTVGTTARRDHSRRVDRTSR